MLPGSARVDFEDELAVVIGSTPAGPEDAWRDVVLGLTVAIDVSARDGSQERPVVALRLDTFCPLGPAIETDVDPALSSKLVDGVVKQSARTSDAGFRHQHAHRMVPPRSRFRGQATSS